MRDQRVVRCTYYLESEMQPARAAAILAGEQSSGTFVSVPGESAELHEHHGAPDTVCHICQSLHAPVLTVTFSGIASAPQICGWHDSHPVFTAALDEVSLLRPGRAPPSA